MPHASLEISAAGADVAVTPIPGFQVLSLPGNLVESLFTWQRDLVANPLDTRKITINYANVGVEVNGDIMRLNYAGLDFSDTVIGTITPNAFVSKSFPRARGFVRTAAGTPHTISKQVLGGCTVAVVAGRPAIEVTLVGGAMKDSDYQIDRCGQEVITGTPAPVSITVESVSTTKFTLVLPGATETANVMEFHFTVWNHP